MVTKYSIFIRDDSAIEFRKLLLGFNAVTPEYLEENNLSYRDISGQVKVTNMVEVVHAETREGSYIVAHMYLKEDNKEYLDLKDFMLGEINKFCMDRISIFCRAREKVTNAIANPDYQPLMHKDNNQRVYGVI